MLQEYFVIIFQELKGRFYKTIFMLYGLECWTLKKHVHNMTIVEMRTLRWMSINTSKDRIKNEHSWEVGGGSN